ncbi:MAG: hypothetical protein LUC99_10990, partial [Clostridiales bacterium]|nr:hypothetical protein [Clostridiales bacterium]
FFHKTNAIFKAGYQSQVLFSPYHINHFYATPKLHNLYVFIRFFKLFPGIIPGIRIDFSENS